MNFLTFSNGKRVLPLCINLERSKDRKENVQRICSDHNMPINFIKAFDKNFLVNADTGSAIETSRVLCGLSDYIEGVTQITRIASTDDSYKDRIFHYTPPSMASTVYQSYVNSLYLGAVGCAMSHMECFRIFNETTDVDYLLVLEDDVSIIGSSIDVLGQVTENDFDLCLVGTSPHGKPLPSNHPSNDSDLLYEPASRWYCGSSAYIITKKFAAKFSPFNSICFAADEFFGFCQLDMRAKLLAMNHPYFGLSSFAQETTNPTGV